MAGSGGIAPNADLRTDVRLPIEHAADGEHQGFGRILLGDVAPGAGAEPRPVPAPPDIIARGVAFEQEVRPLLDEARQVVVSILTEGGTEMRTEWSEVQIKVRKALRRFLDRRAERRPLILPTIIEV